MDVCKSAEYVSMWISAIVIVTADVPKIPDNSN